MGSPPPRTSRIHRPPSEPVHTQPCKFSVSVPESGSQGSFVLVAVINVIADQVISAFSTVPKVLIDHFSESDQLLFENLTQFLVLRFVSRARAMKELLYYRERRGRL